MLIGIDFDITIAGYDALFVDAARRLFGLVMMVSPARAASAKTAIRDALRAEPGGELRWQELQAEVYGSRMAEAEPMPGVEAFLSAANDRGLPMRIISHKTRYAAADPGGVDLRKVRMHLRAKRQLARRRPGSEQVGIVGGVGGAAAAKNRREQGARIEPAVAIAALLPQR